MSKSAVAAVKRAMVQECMKQGITDYTDVWETCLDAVDGIGENTVAAHKAWKTIRKDNRIACRHR